MTSLVIQFRSVAGVPLGDVRVQGDLLDPDPSVASIVEAWQRAGRSTPRFVRRYRSWSNGYTSSEMPSGTATKSTRTPMLSSTPHSLGTHGLWGDPDAKLPDYIENVAAGLMDNGRDESSAIRLAIGAVERWKDGGQHVTPEVQTAAAKAWAEWEALKASHNKTKE